MEKTELKEIKEHGTEYFPCGFYYMDGKNPEGVYVKHHWHSEVEIIHVEKGEFTIEVDMKKYKIDRECLCFINSEELHFIKSSYPYKANSIVFNLRMLSFDMLDSIQAKLINPLLSGELKLPRFIFSEEEEWEDINRAYKKLSEVFEKEGEFFHGSEIRIKENIKHQIEIKYSILNILGSLHEKNLLIREESKGKDYRIDCIKKIISYIKDNYGDKISIKDLANEVNMNEQYFCRFFRKMLGKSPMKYVNEYRIKKTKILLRETDRKVMDIALECGFNNIGNFIKVFKKYTEVNPNNYRKSHKNIILNQ